MPIELTVRPARPDEAEKLRALTVESKAWWGYAPDLLREWGEALDIAAALREDGEAIARRVAVGVRSGDILLLHDSDAYSARGSWERTVAALPAVAERLEGAALRTVHVAG